MTLTIVAIVLFDVAVIGGLALLMRTAAAWGTGPREMRQRQLRVRRPAARPALVRTARGAIRTNV
jgi:hypothetical protein